MQDIEDLALDIIDQIPSHPRDTPADAASIISNAGDDEEKARKLIDLSRGGDVERLDGRPERISGMLDICVWHVREALNYLEFKTTEDVVSVSMDDGRHWVCL